MFKLVGDDVFQLNDEVRCIIRVNPAPGFKFEYSLFVDGKSYEQYKDRQATVLKTWQLRIGEKNYRVVMGEYIVPDWISSVVDSLSLTSLLISLYLCLYLEKDTLNVFLNGILREEEGEFVDGGTDTVFEEDNHEFRVSGRQSDAQRKGLVYELIVDGVQYEEAKQE